MLMPFGVHKGKELSAVPADYLGWLKTRELRQPLRAEVDAEIKRRLEPGAPVTDAAVSQEVRRGPARSSRRRRRTESQYPDIGESCSCCGGRCRGEMCYACARDQHTDACRIQYASVATLAHATHVAVILAYDVAGGLSGMSRLLGDAEASRLRDRYEQALQSIDMTPAESASIAEMLWPVALYEDDRTALTQRINSPEHERKIA